MTQALIKEKATAPKLQAIKLSTTCTHNPIHFSARSNLCIGAQGEDYVAAVCENAGMQILARNWRCKSGELDIIARDGDEIVAIEVKTRSGTGYGDPLEAITPIKLRRLQKLLFEWVRTHKCGYQRIRIDAAAVLALPGQNLRLSYLEAASHD